MEDIKVILEKINSDVLSDESKSEIEGLFESVVEAKVESVITERVDTALSDQDEKHTTILENLLESIDNNRTEKLKTLFAKIDENHSAKLLQLKEHYENLLTTEARNAVSGLEQTMSDFLDMAIDKALPKNILGEAVTNIRSRKILDQVKTIVAVDEDFINENIKEALLEGKQRIDSLESQINDVLKENIKVSTSKSKLLSENALLKACDGLEGAKRDFITESLTGKSVEFINKNFDNVVTMFEKNESRVMEVEKQTVLTEKVDLVDIPAEDVATSKNEVIDLYLEGMEG